MSYMTEANAIAAALRGKAPNQRKAAGKLSRRISPWRRLPVRLASTPAKGKSA